MASVVYLSCLAKARYTMLADIYEQTTTRDPDTGETSRTWSYSATVPCQARGVISEGIRTVGSTEGYTRALNKYEEEDWVKMKSQDLISKRARVTNIRFKSSDTPTWVEDDGVTPMVFEVQGSQPLPNPFGRTIEHETLLFIVQDGLWEQQV